MQDPVFGEGVAQHLFLPQPDCCARAGSRLAHVRGEGAVWRGVQTTCGESRYRTHRRWGGAQHTCPQASTPLTLLSDCFLKMQKSWQFGGDAVAQ